MTGCHDDLSLVNACRAGQTEAFGDLVRKYQDRLYPTILRLVGSPEDAQDVLQDAFIRAFEKLEQFHGESSFYTWIYRIAVNLALSGHRKRQNRGGGGLLRPGPQRADHGASRRVSRRTIPRAPWSAWSVRRPSRRRLPPWGPSIGR